jgi:hypothetical protein
MKTSSLLILLLFCIHQISAKELPKDWQSRAFIESNPDFEKTFKFNSDQDLVSACNDTYKTIDILSAIENGLHPDPSHLGVSSYTCNRCFRKITQSSFRAISDAVFIFGKLEACPASYNGYYDKTELINIEPDYSSTSTNTNSNSNSSNNSSGEVYSFTSSIPFSRFQESPCSHLGYNPYDDMEVLDKKYCECENKYYWNLVWKILAGVVVLSGVGYMIYLSRRRKKN